MLSVMHDGTDDADIRAMKAAKMRPLLYGLAGFGGLVAACGLYVLTGVSSVRSSLEQEGYTDVNVKMNGPLDYGFTAKKGGATCGGTVTRMPFSTSRQEMCFETK